MSGERLPALLATKRCVIFDLDGTLYRQRPLRLRMAALLAADAMRRRDLTTARVLRAYRRARERFGDERRRDFEHPLRALCARECSVDPSLVDAIVEDWIETRPLPYLARCRVAGVEVLFDALRARSVRIAVLSDYPARAKLAALGLVADIVRGATDPDIGVMKPDPAGVRRILELADCAPTEAIVIGDRADRDGAAAAAAGVGFILRGAPRGAATPTLNDFTPASLAGLPAA